MLQVYVWYRNSRKYQAKYIKLIIFGFCKRFAYMINSLEILFTT